MDRAVTFVRRFAHRPGDVLMMMLAVIALWQAGHWGVGSIGLAGPAETMARLWVLAQRPAFRGDVADTAVAFVLSAAISVGAGVLSRLLGRVVEPVLSSFYALPKVTLYPVVLLLFGLGFSAKVAFGVMHGLIPIVLVTMHAVLQVRPVHLRTARAMRLGLGQTITAVVLPSIVPEVLGGVRIGVPLALLGVLIGEMFASRRGLGSVAMRAMEANDGATLLAVAVLASAAALGVNAGLRRLVGRQP
jgi:NitT/TauT family transport system permease protein